MKLTELHCIKSLGNFLSEYESDLYYIEQFQKFKNNQISIDDYLKKEKGMFTTFIIEYRVARNIPVNKRKELLFFLKEELKNFNINVDSLAQKMKDKDLTYGKSVSLCSKILFLNNPLQIIPIDTLARKSLKIKNNNYSEFRKELKNFIDTNDSKINQYLNSIKKYTLKIENQYRKEDETIFQSIEIIRKNRFIDKLLWTQN